MNKWICIGESTILDLDKVTAVTKQADHILYETDDSKVIEVVYNSEPEAKDAIVKLIGYLGVNCELGGEIIESEPQ
jgi:hypothetical protein